MDMMTTSAMNALENVLDLKADESVLVVTDDSKGEIGNAFRNAAERLGATVDIYRLDGSKRPLSELTEDLSSLLEGRDVFINAFSGMAEETPFRISLVKTQMGTNARVGHAPGIDERMMTSGPMTADFQALSVVARELMDRFIDAVEVLVTAPGGTDITMDITSRGFQTDVHIGRGAMGNLPAGEIWCAPVEDGANGTIVCDGSIGDLGPVNEPVSIEVSQGRIVSISGDDIDLVDRINELSGLDDDAKVIGELGIGLNPKAVITGNLLEDEKAGRTAHIAFGNNESMPNGRNRSKTHRDYLFHRPNFTVKYADGSQQEIIRDGDVV